MPVNFRQLLNTQARQRLFNGGRTTSNDAPVIALGAGYVPIIQEGSAHSRLRPQGPYGPLHMSSVAHQQGGRMSMVGGYFDGSGNPHRYTQHLGQGRTDIWYLNLPNQSEMQHQGILDIRRLYRMAEATPPPQQILSDAMEELRSTGLFNSSTSVLNVLGSMQVGGVDVDTFDLWSVLDTPGLRYSAVWRELRDIINIIDEDGLEGSGTNAAPAMRSVKRLMAAALLNPAGLGAHIPRERNTIADLQRVYDTSAATHTNSLLSFLNERMREGIRRQHPSFAQTQAQGADVPIDESAVMPEEHAAGITGAGGTPESQGLRTGMGNTGSMDYAINFMGQIYVGDVSNMEITTGYHHGLSRGAIMTTAEVDELIANQDEAGIHDRIYNYYRREAMPDWNAALREIKRVAAATYSSTMGHSGGQSTLRPGQVRNPFGPSSQARHGVSARGGFRTPGQGFPTNVLSVLPNNTQISTATNAMLNNIPSLMGTHAQRQGAASAVAFVNHMMGTWHQHLGQSFHSMRISADPHITFTAFFEQFTSGRAIYLFNIPAFTREKLILQDGYALLDILQNTGHITAGHVDDTIFQMKSAELIRRTRGNLSSIRIGRNTQIGATGIINSNNSRATLSVNLPDNMEQEIIDNILTQMEPPPGTTGPGMGTGNYPGPPTRDLMLARTLRHSMGQRSAFNQQLATTQIQYLRQGRYWPHLASLWAAPYMARLRRS